jgi:glycosyltransferase involved in cell wall biosynthesis
MHFAILSHVLPPSPSGQAVVLYRILSEINQDNFYLIKSREDSLQNKQSLNNSFQLQAQYYHLHTEPFLNGQNILGFSLIINIVNIFIRIIARAKNISSIIRSESTTTAIIACSGDLLDIPAGFLASQMAHIPFYAYIFDDYAFQWTGNYRRFAKLVSPFIFKHSAGVIGPNEYICEEYKRRYGVSSILVRNPCDKDELDNEPISDWPSENGKIKIIFTGAVYHANYDCFRNLIKAMDFLEEHKPELHIFTSQTRNELEDQEIQSDKIFIHSHIPYSDILKQQRKADILFLPLAFKSPIPEVIHTSAPGKMGEYLASGRPVLAHVPANSFVADYFEKNQCGWVADKNDPHLLANTIKKIILDQELRTSITRNALKQAKIDYSPDKARDQLLRLMRGQ